MRESESVSHSVLSDSVTPWTVARQAPPSMEFSRQECWSGLPCPLPGHLPDPGIKPRSTALQADSSTSEPNESAYKVLEPSLTQHIVSPKRMCYFPRK